ncbi:MAG: SdpI family protein [Bacteriovorax sp.]|nr:SdpI family protein [Rhizobacter sp.]
MLERRADQVQLAFIAAMGLAGLWVLLRLPPGALVPIHFDANGTPNGWAEPAMGVFLMPALAAMSWGLQALLPKIDPRGHNLVRSAGAVDTIFTAVTVLLAALQALIVSAASGALAPPSSLGLVLVGGLLMVIGNVMGKLRTNYTVGIRTPWTLADERVWDQTHRFGGKAFVLAGALLCVLAALPLNPSWQGPAIVVVAVVSAGAVTLKSYLLWRALQRPSG